MELCEHAVEQWKHTLHSALAPGPSKYSVPVALEHRWQSSCNPYITVTFSLRGLASLRKAIMLRTAGWEEFMQMMSVSLKILRRSLA